MSLRSRQQALDAFLMTHRPWWSPQPFREPEPTWAKDSPALHSALLALDEAQTHTLNDDVTAAQAWLARWIPELRALDDLQRWPRCPASNAPALRDAAHWTWEIPGRKQAQIEALLAVLPQASQPILDWCGGKGHLGRALAMRSGHPVTTREIDPGLCLEGARLADRAQVPQKFVCGDVLTAQAGCCAHQQVLALHACGELHRQLVRRVLADAAPRIDLVPCCFFKGVTRHYVPLSGDLGLVLQVDDLRLAVTETVTASAREARQRDREMAWRLGFDAWRRAVTDGGYRSFKPIPAAWFRGSFEDFMTHIAAREQLAPFWRPGDAEHFQHVGWQRWQAVQRLSIVRHAYRRAIEAWLLLDLAVALEQGGYAVQVGTFCDRRLTPRNTLISACR